jgi:flavin reductase (DIM6/NTAB) family NADH-FMN oxidoreductase RutF
MSASISAAELKAVMARFASGVTIVTTVDARGQRWGLTVSAFSSLSLDPPLCLVCIDHRAGSLGALREARRFAVSMLSAEQAELSNKFASRSDDKFAGVAWRPAPVTGCPVFPDATAWLDCELADAVTGGDHEVMFGAIKAANVSDRPPLLYWNGAYGDLTSRPKSW